MIKASTRGPDPALSDGLTLFLSRAKREERFWMSVCPSSTAFLSQKDEFHTLCPQTSLDFGCVEAPARSQSLFSSPLVGRCSGFHSHLTKGSPANGYGAACRAPASANAALLCALAEGLLRAAPAPCLGRGQSHKVPLGWLGERTLHRSPCQPGQAQMLPLLAGKPLGMQMRTAETPMLGSSREHHT